MNDRLDDPTPDTGNERYFDAALRHQIGIRRFSSGEVKKILKILEKSDKELIELLRKRLAKLAGKPLDLTSQRYKALLKDIKKIREAVVSQMRSVVKDDLLELAVMEQDFEKKILKAVLPVNVEFTTVAVSTLQAVVTQQPFAGGTAAARTLQTWFDDLKRVDQKRVVEAVQLGLTQGETVDQMVRRIAGTRKANYADGVLAVSRRNAETIVRTATNHVSNAARETFWQENEEYISALRWTSTLDGRTSAICRSRDGKLVLLGDSPLPAGEKKLEPQGARPPAHPNCRSVMIAVLDDVAIADQLPNRPFVRDARTRKEREIDFRAEAKAQVGSAWSGMTTQQRNKIISSVRRSWGEQNIGRLPGTVTYNEWLKRQPAAFQDEVLGRSKAQLFRKGGLSLDQFTDRRGNELSLEELKLTQPQAFQAAGVSFD